MVNSSEKPVIERKIEILRTNRNVISGVIGRLLTPNGIEMIIEKTQHYLVTIFRDGSVKEDESPRIRYVIRKFLEGPTKSVAYQTCYRIGNPKDCIGVGIVEDIEHYNIYDHLLKTPWGEG